MPYIKLTPDDVKWCLEEGKRTEELFHGLPGSYQTDNSLLNHVIGKLGEVAVQRWIEQQQCAGVVDPAFRNIERISECDIIYEKYRLEVKTWNAGTWRRGGRCIAPKQAPNIQNKADAVVWCRLKCHMSSIEQIQEGQPVQVEVVGWSTPSEISATTPVDTSFDNKEKLNHQVPEDNVRPLTSLLTVAR